MSKILLLNWCLASLLLENPHNVNAESGYMQCHF